MVKEVERYQEEFSKIKEVLKNTLKGMTITEISKEIGLNRNSTAKYLDILQVLGDVEMRIFGTAKVFYPSDRIPLSSLMNFSSDALIIIDKNLRFVKVNEGFIELTNIDREKIVGIKINKFSFPIFDDPELILKIKNSLRGKTTSFERDYIFPDKNTYFFLIDLIPIIFADAEPGLFISLRDISKRKKAELELKESEAKFRTIFESIPDLFFLTSNDSTILDYNGNQKYIPTEVFLNKKMTEILPLNLRKLANEYIQKVVDTKEPQTIEFKFQYKEQLVDYEARILYFSKDRLGIFIRDISIRKKAENKLMESEEIFRKITEQSLIGILIFQDGIIKYMNKAVETIFEYTNNELLNFSPQEVMNLLTSEERDIARTRMLEISKNKDEIPPFESYSIITKSGNKKSVEIFGNIIQFQGKNAFLTAIIDITEKIENELKILKSESMYRAIFEGVFEGIIIADIETTEFLFVNPSMCRILGYSKEELTQMSIHDIHLKDDLDYALSEFQALVQGEKRISENIPCLRKDGTIVYVNISISNIIIDEKDYILVFFIINDPKKPLP